MKKVLSILLSSILILSIFSSCSQKKENVLEQVNSIDTLDETENISKDSLDLFDIQSEDDSITLATSYIERLYGVITTDLQKTAEYNQNSDIQPNGWFVRVFDSDWDYAVWLQPESNRIKVSRGSSMYLLTTISDDLMKEIKEDDTWIENAKKVILDNLDENQEIKSIDFKDQDNESVSTVDIVAEMEDGRTYILSYYSDGLLKDVVWYEK